MAEGCAPHSGGRALRPPTGPTPLDRAWQSQQWRLAAAHDDFALHASAGDPRARIHAATGLARFRRRAVRECLLVYRRTAAKAGVQSDAATAARTTAADAFRAYRLAIAELADAVAGFNARNGKMVFPEAPSEPQGATGTRTRDLENCLAPIP